MAKKPRKATINRGQTTIPTMNSTMKPRLANT